MSTPAPSQPEYLAFQCPLTIEAADGSGQKRSPRFHMVAYTGGLMRVEGFPHPVVVDLGGLTIPRQDLPVRLDHNPRQGVGHTRRVVVEGTQVIAEGVVSRDTSWARDVASSGLNGFPWQASIGAVITEAEFIPHGSRIAVNNHTFQGPLHVVRRALLKEISFVDSGADTGTTARIAANAKEPHPMPPGTPGSTPTPGTHASANSPASSAATPGSSTTPTDMTATATVDTDDAVQAVEGQDDDAGAAGTTPARDTTPHTSHTTATTAAASSATTTPSTLNASAHGHQGDPVTDVRRRMAAELRRVDAIRALCNGKHPTIEARAIEEGWDETHTELHLLRASRPQVPAATSRSGNANFRGPQVFEAVALMAAGCPTSRLEAAYAGPVLEAAHRLRGVGIQEFCELACGRTLPRFRSDAGGWLQAAFSTASLPGILSNIANKMLLEGYNYVENAWRSVVRIASVNDFKEHTRYRMTGAFTFEQVGPDGELKHGKLDEQKFVQKAETHGIMFSLTRQMIINDDMGAFTDIPRQIGMGAGESITDAVWSRWLSNPEQPDGQPFFSVAHKNYAAGVDTALTIDGLTAAEVLFAEQTKPNGRPLGIPASILLVPTALKVPAALLMTSMQVNETTTTNKPKPASNPHVGKFDVVSSSYLSNASFTGASARAWYLLADPNRLPGIEVAFLNGVDRPTVERADADFNRLGVQFRGFIDFGVREQDFRAAAKFKGEA